jgi:hypothetical protein
MAKRKGSYPPQRKRKGRGAVLPVPSLDPDAVFTMVLASHKYINDSLKGAGIRVSSKKLMANILTAIENTFDGVKTEKEKITYNLAADALASAYISFTANDKSYRNMVKLAFQSPDCSRLMDALAALNTKAEGMMTPKDLYSDDEAFTNSLDSAPTEEIKDITGGPNSDDDEDHGAENSQTEDAVQVSQASRKVRAKVKRLLADIMEDDDEGNEMQEVSDPANYAITQRVAGKVVKTLPMDVDGDVGTMKTGNPLPPNQIDQLLPDEPLHDVSLMSTSKIAALAATNPQLIALANKISLSGTSKSRKLAQNLIDKVIQNAA